MNFSLYIARRYLVSLKSQNVINLISAISVIGIAIGTMALIIVLSVFNGFENLVISLYSSFDPAFQITLKEGKTFDASLIPAGELKKIKGVMYVAQSLEENALLKYNEDKQYLATLKGVSDDFIVMTGLDSMIIAGKLLLKNDGLNYAVLGNNIAYALAINIDDLYTPINVYAPIRGKKISSYCRHDSKNLLSCIPVPEYLSSSPRTKRKVVN